MKKFAFELQEILDIRKFQQQQAEMELGKALNEEKAVQDKIDNLALQIVNIKKMSQGSSDFQVISSASEFYIFAKKQTEYLLEQLSQLKLVSEQKREALRKCMQKTDALESLKESQKLEYNENVKKQEEKERDEIVTGRFGRKF